MGLKTLGAGNRPQVNKMERLVLSMVTVVTVVGLAGWAAADAGNYVNPNGGVGVSLSITNCANDVQGTGMSIGGIRFCAGHVTPDLAGENILTIIDGVNSPASGTYCQDWNGNSICGEISDPVTGDRSEPRVRFCGSQVLQSPPDPTPRPSWPTDNWDTAHAILVFIDSPGNGNPANSVCGLVFSNGVIGQVNHN
jgi:hypothetical protein